MGRRTDGQTDVGWMYKWTGDRRSNGWMNGQIDVWIGGWLDGEKDG